MIEILRYLLLSSLIWGILVLAYPMISPVGSLVQRRWYLLLTLIGGALLPLMQWSSPEMPLIVLTLPEVVTNTPISDSVTTRSGWTWLDLSLFIYSAGLTVRAGYAVHGLIRLMQLCRKGIRTSYKLTPIRLLPFDTVPFHVFGQLYFPNSLVADTKAFHMAYKHELAHRQLGHGLDLFLGNLLRILFWFQPLVPVIIRELRLVHEFQADQAVIHEHERDTYARFIGTFRSTQPIHPAMHTISQSPLKQRIMQMYNTPTTWKLPHFALLLILASILTGTTAFSGISWKNQAGSNTLSVLDSIPDSEGSAIPGAESESFTIAEVMPRFPGCEDQGLTGLELNQCAQRKMLEYIYTHLKYPEEAIKNEVEGTSIASFIVEKDGSISSIQIVRDIGGGTGEETTRVLQQMQEEGIRWIPGEQDGQKVRVVFNLPIKFKLTDSDPGMNRKKRSKK